MLLAGLALLGSNGCTTEVYTQTHNFCDFVKPNASGSTSYMDCQRVPSFAGPDWDEEPFVFMDSATGRLDTVLVTSRSQVTDIKKAHIPKIHFKFEYDDEIVERFLFHGSGFDGGEKDFHWEGEAKSNSFTASWGPTHDRHSIFELAYKVDSVPGRPFRDTFQTWHCLNVNPNNRQVLSVEFIETLGLYKLRVGPYQGQTRTYIRQNLLY